MNRQWLKVASIARNELRMQWRRGSLRTLMFVLLVAPILLTLSMSTRPADVQAAIDAGRANAAQQQAVWTATGMVIASMLPGVLGVIVSVLVADTIAIDRQYGMSEMLGSLPLSPGAYLAGKLLSVWGSVLALLAVTAILSGAIVQSVLGPIDVGVIAGYWLAAGLPLGLFASGFGVLWAARQPTRQRAALIGFALTPVCMAMAAILVGDFMLVAGVRSTVALSLLDLSAAPDYPSVLAPAHLIKLAVMLAAIAGSALFVRGRMQRQEQP